jgi:hypothetical protein
MISPGPRYVTTDPGNRIYGTPDTPGATNERRKSAAIELARYIAARGSFAPGADATGTALVNIRSMLRQAGLTDDWAVVKEKFVTVDKSVPGYINGVPGDNRCPEQLHQACAERLRAWAMEFAPDLIDPTAEQTAEAVMWGWW